MSALTRLILTTIVLRPEEGREDKRKSQRHCLRQRAATEMHLARERRNADPN